MNILKLVLGGLLLLTLGLGIGYFEAPDKIKTVEKIVEVEKKVTETDHKTTKEYDPNTGKITKETEETGTKITDTETKKTDKETEKTKTQKQYALKGGVAINPRDLSGKLIPRVGAEIALPFFSSSLGIEGDINLSNPLIGAYVRVGF